jgi:hypothetical protein
MQFPTLSKSQIQAFQALAKSKFGLELDYLQAAETANNLFQSFILLNHARRNLRSKVIGK